MWQFLWPLCCASKNVVWKLLTSQKCADVFFGWKYTLKTEWINVKVLRIGPKSSHRMNTYERWVRIAGCTNEMIARSIDWLYYFEPIELLWSHPTNNFYTLNSRLFRLALCLPQQKNGLILISSIRRIVWIDWAYFSCLVVEKSIKRHRQQPY